MNSAAGTELPVPAQSTTTATPIARDVVDHDVMLPVPDNAALDLVARDARLDHVARDVLVDHVARDVFVDDLTRDVIIDDDALTRLRHAFASVDPGDPFLGDVDHPRYRALDVLGEGGMGTVYCCHDELLGREVAMKVVRATPPARQKMLAARLQAESRILARLEHTGIVPIHDVGQLADGRVFYVMQRLRGRTLRAVLSDHESGRATVSLARRLDVMERITEAVAYAHEQGIVHRDLKPDNVMIGDFGEVHVTDWGVARVLNDENPVDLKAVADDDAVRDGLATHESRERLTADGTVIGTPGYMAPEQAAGLARAVGPTADVFALGALLLALLAGRAVDTTLAPAEQLGFALTTVPPPLRAIVHRCVEYDAAQRYPHAGALLDELRRFRGGDPVLAHRESVVERVMRRLRPWRTALVLIVAYLVMRIFVAWLGDGRNFAGAP